MKNFNWKLYTSLYPDITNFNEKEAIKHYVKHGKQENRICSIPEDFDAATYLKLNPDIVIGGFNTPELAYKHWHYHGKNEFRPPYHSTIYHEQYTKKESNPTVSDEFISQSTQASCSLSFSDIIEEDCIIDEPLYVIIPIYTKNPHGKEPGSFYKCLNSIYKIYSQKQKLAQNIEILVINDCLIEIPDFIVHIFNNLNSIGIETYVLQNKRNLGFVESINRGISLAHKKNGEMPHVVILNSDTEVSVAIFNYLYKYAQDHPDAGSITPMSNCSTLTSILNYPKGLGGDQQTYKNIKKTIDIYNKLNPSINEPNNKIASPTGVGFCMFMRKDCLKHHLLDSIFSPGYGEENDWCQKIQKLGYKNHIYTQHAIYHHDSKSFNNKKQKIANNLKNIIQSRYPNYINDVVNFFSYGPHRFIGCLMNLIYESKDIEVFLLHSDKKYGGTEKHVQDAILDSDLSKKNILRICKKSLHKGYVIEIISASGSMWTTVSPADLSRFIKKFFVYVSMVNVHHLSVFSDEHIKLLTKIPPSKKTFVFHDYNMFCDSPKLLCSRTGELCKTSFTGKPCKSIDYDRYQLNMRFIKSTDNLFAPSQNTADNIKKITKGAVRVAVKGHTLNISKASFQKYENNTILSNHSPHKVVFLGADFLKEGQKSSKGLDIFNQACAIYKAKPRNYNLEFCHYGLGAYGYEPYFTKYGSYDSGRLHELPQPTIVLILSPWPETFCYTLFESIYIFKCPIVSTNLGNPAQIVAKHNLGTVLNRLDAESINTSIKHIMDNYNRYSQNIGNYIRNNPIQTTDASTHLY